MTPPTDPDERRWRRAPSTLWRRVPDGVLLLDGAADPTTGADPVLLTDPGAAVWAALARPATLTGLATDLADAFAADPAAVAADLATALADLAGRGLVLADPEP